jgi:hypothetical protein
MPSLIVERVVDGSIATSSLADDVVTTNKLAPDIGIWNRRYDDISYEAGKVGIGTDSPDETLHVFGRYGNVLKVDSGSGNSGGIDFAVGGGVKWHAFSHGTDYDFKFYGTGFANEHSLVPRLLLPYANSNIFLALSGGAVGIGTETPRARLDVQGDLVTTGNVGIGTGTPGVRLEVHGNVKFGLDGQFFVPATEENLRLLRGVVGNNGNIVAGNGFTVIRVGTGDYLIFYNTTFDGTPTVTATAFDTSGPQIVTLVQNLTDFCEVKVWTTAGALVDSQFHFMVIGPR